MPIRASLLDRLIDETPELQHDPVQTRTEELRAIRNGFRRDLEALLNTRRLCRTPPPAYAELTRALPHYGVEDFVGAQLATHAERLAFASSVEKTIRIFEPRFTAVTVTPVRAEDPAERRQVIRIEAVARLEHGPEPVTFETALDPITRRFHVQ